jgi:rubredoxin
LVREFEEADLRTYQLCFAIKTQPKTGLSGSVIIKKNKNGLYDLLHTKDFNPNTKDYVIYLEQVQADLLSANLVSLCKSFYDLQSNSIHLPATDRNNGVDLLDEFEEIYQCNNCLTRYDKQYGDPVNCIDKNIEFTVLTNYCCPVCEAPKSEFSLVASFNKK